jgi:branched-chain amino acid transport system permease protein
VNSFLQLAALGVAQGSFLLIASLGFSLTRRVEGFLNIAHAQYLSVSAFVTFFLNNSMGIHFVVAALAGVLAAVAVGFLFGKVVYEPIRRLGPAVLLITSVGVVYMLEGIIEAVIGTGSFLVTLPRIAPVRFGPIAITFYQVMVVAVAILVTAGTAWFLQRTRIGTAIRITSLDRNLGASRGVDVRQAANASWVPSQRPKASSRSSSSWRWHSWQGWDRSGRWSCRLSPSGWPVRFPCCGSGPASETSSPSGS